jgi:hypothetical protein
MEYDQSTLMIVNFNLSSVRRLELTTHRMTKRAMPQSNAPRLATPKKLGTISITLVCCHR